MCFYSCSDIIVYKENTIHFVHEYTGHTTESILLNISHRYLRLSIPITYRCVFSKYD